MLVATTCKSLVVSPLVKARAQPLALTLEDWASWVGKIEELHKTKREQQNKVCSKQSVQQTKHAQQNRACRVQKTKAFVRFAKRRDFFFLTTRNAILRNGKRFRNDVPFRAGLNAISGNYAGGMIVFIKMVVLIHNLCFSLRPI